MIMNYENIHFVLFFYYYFIFIFFFFKKKRFNLMCKCINAVTSQNSLMIKIKHY